MSALSQFTALEHIQTIAGVEMYLPIFNNVNRDHHDWEDLQAYDLKGCFPDADYEVILITSWLAPLQKHRLGIKVGTVATEQERAILGNDAGRVIPGK